MRAVSPTTGSVSTVCRTVSAAVTQMFASPSQVAPLFTTVGSMSAVCTQAIDSTPPGIGPASLRGWQLVDHAEQRRRADVPDGLAPRSESRDHCVPATLE
jgi:hypothetical protein